MRYEMYRDSSNQYRWRLQAANGRTIAHGGESYINRQDCINAVKLVMSTSTSTGFFEV